MLGIDQIARLAAEEARKEQNRNDGGTFGQSRKPTLAPGAKEKVCLRFATFSIVLIFKFSFFSLLLYL